MTEMFNTGRTRASYTSPMTKVVEIGVHGMLCTSGDTSKYGTDVTQWWGND